MSAAWASSKCFPKHFPHGRFEKFDNLVLKLLEGFGPEFYIYRGYTWYFNLLRGKEGIKLRNKWKILTFFTSSVKSCFSVGVVKFSEAVHMCGRGLERFSRILIFFATFTISEIFLRSGREGNLIIEMLIFCFLK